LGSNPSVSAISQLWALFAPEVRPADL
jgi:hypothetical protein